MAMANKVTAVARIEKDDQIRRLLTAELDGIADRLHRGADAPIAEVGGGNFLDLAQGLEHQEQEHLVASRLMEQARRLHVALTRVNNGEYGVCSECGATIPAKRLLAVPDATTCVACQGRLEHVGAAVRTRVNGGVDGEEV
jgi:DnaK suppressor protein